MTEHPITPPPGLVKQWRAAASNVPATLSTDSGGRRDYIDFIATRAAQWGADQELEACCEWLEEHNVRWDIIATLRAVRRPKPPSLKEQSIALIDRIQAAKEAWDISELGLIRRALEQLDD